MRNATSDDDWQDLRNEWQIPSDVTYLNHGSFGPPPRPVIEARAEWQRRMDSQPMDFFVRQFRPAWEQARAQLARFIGANEKNIVFTENATAAMNIVAQNFPLSSGDSVLLTDHEYGAVERIWQRRTMECGARVSTARLPTRIESVDQVIDAIFSQVNESTRLIVVSHITSPTAITMPVAEICRLAREASIPVCIDGPHAIAQLPVELERLTCDFYTASCHKWLSAPFGSGLLYVTPRRQELIRPPQLSWGVLLPERPSHWSEEFIWSGTRDSSAYLAVPTAIDFLEHQVGMAAYRNRTWLLARVARAQLTTAYGRQPIVPDEPQWYGSMAHVPITPGDAQRLQHELWRRFRIEVPIIDFRGERFVRVSCHLYTTIEDVARLVVALRQLTDDGL